MFGIRPKLPVSDEERTWVDEGFRRLSIMLGHDRMLNAKVILPTDEFFPDPYDKGESGLRPLFRRVCEYMGVDPDRVDLEVIPDVHQFIEALPEYRISTNGAAGLHFGETQERRALIAIKQSLLKDPLRAIATLAHELGHVILLDDGHMRRNAEDMEPMTDLVTVFLGMGIFTANTARRFVQFQEDRRQGWSMSHQGYLPEIVYGYALARFAKVRGEPQPDWTRHLTTNVRSYFRRSAAWLSKDAPIFR
jgi:hypothetical protein